MSWQVDKSGLQKPADLCSWSGCIRKDVGESGLCPAHRALADEATPSGPYVYPYTDGPWWEPLWSEAIVRAKAEGKTDAEVFAGLCERQGEAMATAAAVAFLRGCSARARETVNMSPVIPALEFRVAAFDDAGDDIAAGHHLSNHGSALSEMLAEAERRGRKPAQKGWDDASCIIDDLRTRLADAERRAEELQAQAKADAAESVATMHRLSSMVADAERRAEENANALHKQLDDARAGADACVRRLMEAERQRDEARAAEADAQAQAREYQGALQNYGKAYRQALADFGIVEVHERDLQRLQSSAGVVTGSRVESVAGDGALPASVNETRDERGRGNPTAPRGSDGTTEAASLTAGKDRHLAEVLAASERQCQRLADLLRVVQVEDGYRIGVDECDDHAPAYDDETGLVGEAKNCRTCEVAREIEAVLAGVPPSTNAPCAECQRLREALIDARGEMLERDRALGRTGVDDKRTPAVRRIDTVLDETMANVIDSYAALVDQPASPDVRSDDVLSEAVRHAVLTGDDPPTCTACLSPGDDNCPVMRAYYGEAPPASPEGSCERCEVLTSEQVASLVRWANASTTGWGPAFNAALTVAHELARRTAQPSNETPEEP